MGHRHIRLDLGLFRADGLGVSRLLARQTELAKKQMFKIFKENGSDVTVHCTAGQIAYSSPIKCCCES